MDGSRRDASSPGQASVLGRRAAEKGAVIRLQNVTKRFAGRAALDNVSIDVHRGDIFGLLGPNGSGKTTTLRLIEGLLEPDTGGIMVLDGPPAARMGRLNALPESQGVYGWMRATEYLRLFAELHGTRLSSAQIEGRIASVGLDARDRRPLRAFSRGMRQRLGLARAMINDPEVVLLDEPTSGLDPRGRADIHDLLLRLNREDGLTIVLSTHILDDVERLCNRIAILDRGQVRYQGPPQGATAPTRLAVRVDEPAAMKTWTAAGIRVAAVADAWVHLELEGVGPSEALARLAAEGIRFSEAKSEGRSLDDLYRANTSGGPS